MSTLKGLTCISYELDQRADLMLQFEWRKCPDAAVFQTKPRNFIMYLLVYDYDNCCSYSVVTLY